MTGAYYPLFIVKGYLLISLPSKSQNIGLEEKQWLNNLYIVQIVTWYEGNFPSIHLQKDVPFCPSSVLTFFPQTKQNYLVISCLSPLCGSHKKSGATLILSLRGS